MTKAQLDEAQRRTVHFADSLSVDEQDALRSAILLIYGVSRVYITCHSTAGSRLNNSLQEKGSWNILNLYE